MKEFEVLLEKFDYVFAKKTIQITDFFECASGEAARALAYWKYGDCIDVRSVTEF